MQEGSVTYYWRFVTDVVPVVLQPVFLYVFADRFREQDAQDLIHMGGNMTTTTQEDMRKIFWGSRRTTCINVWKDSSRLYLFRKK